MTEYAKLIFNVNKVDSFNIEHTPGFHRRLLIVPFTQFIADEQQDRDLHKKILEDRAGILNWIIEGAEQVVKNRDIFVSEECKACKQKFITEADSVAMFELELRETIRGAFYSETVAESYTAYKTFCQEAGHTRPLGRTNFATRMEAIGFIKVKKDKGMCLEKKYTDEISIKSFKQEVKKRRRY
jgi:putative DNA primase/helicase